MQETIVFKVVGVERTSRGKKKIEKEAIVLGLFCFHMIYFFCKQTSVVGCS